MATPSFICPSDVHLSGKPSNVLKFSTEVSSSIISTDARAFALHQILNLKVAFGGNGPLVFNSVGKCLS